MLEDDRCTVREILGTANGCVSSEVLCANIESAMKRGLPTVKVWPRNNRELVICAGGPSLKHNLKEIRRRATKGVVIAINRVNGYLASVGIRCDWSVLLDPQPVLIEQFTIDRSTCYLVASQVHPEVIDRLLDAGCEVTLWHANPYGAEREVIAKYDPNPIFGGGGSTAALRCFDLGYAHGFRKFHAYGLDGSFEEASEHHAYAQPEDDWLEHVTVTVEGNGRSRTFLTRPDYARQADEFMEIYNGFMRSPDPVTIQIHGDGLIPYIWRQGRKHRG